MSKYKKRSLTIGLLILIIGFISFDVLHYQNLNSKNHSVNTQLNKTNKLLTQQNNLIPQIVDNYSQNNTEKTKINSSLKVYKNKYSSADKKYKATNSSSLKLSALKTKKELNEKMINTIQQKYHTQTFSEKSQATTTKLITNNKQLTGQLVSTNRDIKTLNDAIQKHPTIAKLAHINTLQKLNTKSNIIIPSSITIN